MSQLQLPFMPLFESERAGITCPKCGFVTDREFRFCQSCGTALPQSGAYVEPGENVRCETRQRPSPFAVVSLIMGILGAFPLGVLTGLPAILLGTFVVRRRLTGIGLGLAGIILGLLGTLLTTPAFLLPRITQATEARRRAQLMSAMELLRESLDSCAHSAGSFPTMEYESVTAPPWVPTDLPRNPYTNAPYEFGRDLFYFPEALPHPGAGRISRSADVRCPYNRLSAPESVPGTVVVLGYTDPETEEVSEYAITGFGTDVTLPLWETQTLDDENQERVFLVLNGEVDAAD